MTPARLRVAGVLFLATLFSVSFQNVYWNVAGRVNLADVLALLFLVAFVAGRITERDGLVPTTTLAVLGFAPRALVVYLFGFFNLETNAGALALREGADEVRDPLRVPRGWRRIPRAPLRALLLADARAGSSAGFAANAAYGLLQLAATLGGRNLDALVLQPDHRRRGVDQHLGCGRASRASTA